MFFKSSVVPAVVLFALIGSSCGGSGSTTGPSPTPTATPTPTPAPTPTPQPVTHTLTMIASPSCSALPDAAKKRTYPAQVQEKSDGSIVVLVVNSYDIMVGWANAPGFTGARIGKSVHFDITNDIFGSDYAMVENIGGVGDMGYVGIATGTIDNDKIVATFDGRYTKGYGINESVLCQASDHRVEITLVGS